MSTTVPAEIQAASYGANPKREVNLKIFSLNLYHDFDIGHAVMPYVGAGLGIGDVSVFVDDEIAISLYAGANYDINENFYVGARASFHQVGGPSWEGGGEKTEIDDFNIWTLGVVGGYKF